MSRPVIIVVEFNENIRMLRNNVEKATLIFHQTKRIICNLISDTPFKRKPIKVKQISKRLHNFNHKSVCKIPRGSFVFNINMLNLTCILIQELKAMLQLRNCLPSNLPFGFYLITLVVSLPSTFRRNSQYSAMYTHPSIK